jgi:putative hydrolase of the HAD superfamily
MQMSQNYIMWDFDGTLVYRNGMWSGALCEVWNVQHPENQLEPDQFKPYLKSGFPWHHPELIHDHIQSDSEWWEMVNPVFVRAFRLAGKVGFMQADELSRMVRGQYIDPSKWRVFEDSLHVLNKLASVGYRHAILSNHVPELPALIEKLGLSDFFDKVHTSGRTGFEKPNPMAFDLMLCKLEYPKNVIMIGDSISSDIEGAGQAGIKAFLVRHGSRGVDFNKLPNLLHEYII